MKFKAFKVWYSESTAVGYTLEDWKSLPSEDVQLIAVFYDKKYDDVHHYRDIFVGHDVYTFNGSKFYFKEKGNRLESKRALGEKKFGAWTTEENIARIQKESFEDLGEGWLWTKTEPRQALKETKPDGGVKSNKGMKAA